MRALLLLLALFSASSYSQVSVQEYPIPRGLFAHDVWAELRGPLRDWADDLLQTSLVKLYVAWPRLHLDGREEAYVRQIIVRANIDESRRPWRREVPGGGNARHPGGGSASWQSSGERR